MTSFTLTMLGTDTVFTAKLKDGKKPIPIKVSDYPKGETLSVVSTLIETTQAPEVNLQTQIPYKADEITVINGPNTAGSNVGEKIALGLAATLKAIERGQAPINIIAHSRGAVESILIAHELEEIQKIIGHCDDLNQLFEHLTIQQSIREKSKPTTNYNTPDIIAVLKAQLPQSSELQKTWFQTLKNNMPSASINFFGIDPVPGDVLYPITWYDERYFTLPSIIKNAEIIHYENERTDWGFTPIYPEAVNSEQKIFWQSMPGHHGTGSAGNNASQQKELVSPLGTKATHVQKLMLYKMLGFLNQHGVEFKDAQEVFAPNRALGRKYARPIVNPKESPKTITISQLDFPEIYRELYTKIEQNRAGYRAFDQTNYWGLGRLTHRRMLHKGHKYKQFNEFYSTKVGYINEEHSRLMQNYFFKAFNLVAPNNLAEMIDAASEALKEKIGQINPEHHKDVLEAFGIIIQQVSQKYLSEEWTSTKRQEEKRLLFAASARALSTFSKLATSDADYFFTKLTKLSLSGMINTVKTQHTILKEQFNLLQETPDKKLIHFFKGLLTQLNLAKSIEEPMFETLSSEEPPEIEAQINKIVDSEPYKALANHPINDKISYTWEQLKEEYPAQEPAFVENLITSFEEQYGEYLENFEKLYTQTQVLIDDIVALQKIIPLDTDSSVTLVQCQSSLDGQISPGLIKTTAQKFYQDSPDDLPEIAINDGFLKLAERYAIDNYGVVDRTLEGAMAKANQHYARINNTQEAEFLILAGKLQKLTANYLKTLKISAENIDLCEQKTQLIKELLSCLSDEKTNPYPSNRVRAFYTKLNADPTLKLLGEHRDLTWKRYITNVLIVAGILLSGILPGLLALAAYNTTGNTAGKSYRFWRTAGTNVTENLNKFDIPKSSSTAKDDKDPSSEDTTNNFHI